MNNIFETNKFLKSINANIKYDYWHNQLKKYNKEKIYLKKYNKHINKNTLLEHLNNIKYVIYGNLPLKYGGIEKSYLELLRSENCITDKDQLQIYNNLFNLIIPEGNIRFPLCNSCLQEFNPKKNKNWKTSENKEKEYLKDNDGNEFIGLNYVHICNKCHILLYNKIKPYKKLKMKKFNKNVFMFQLEEFMEYQPICYKLITNNKL